MYSPKVDTYFNSLGTVYISPSSTRALLCLGSWLKCDLVLHDDLVEAINALKKRKVREEDQVDQ
ncbi:hypothetical protein JB92DRAFT_3264738 [Gautieria morchelliformis]|nr:hypothetical protein JB92DRAFT_3264738 [Gautieria morchelliformis]